MNNKALTFEDLNVWKQARTLTRQVYSLTGEKVLASDYGLCRQIQRAAVSAMSNVAEGFERHHLAEKIQFYHIARGSLGEVRSLTYVIEDNYAALDEKAAQVRAVTNQVGPLISGLIRAVEVRRVARRGVLVLAVLAGLWLW